MSHLRFNKRFVLIAVFMLLLLVVVPTLAQAYRAEMTVTPIWRPGQQLTSTPTDLRYVELELHAEGNVQFYAVNIACTVGRGELEAYTWDNDGSATPDDHGDNLPMVLWGPEWTNNGGFVSVDSNDGYEGYDWDGVGTITITATRLGNVPSIGQNGNSYSTLLATLRFRVAQGIDRDSNVSASCRTLDFLDRDGESVVRPRAGRGQSLVLKTGYTVTGTVLRQGSRDHEGIDVSCDNIDDADPALTATTDRSGKFEFGGRGSTLRDFGWYECTYDDPVTNSTYVSKSTGFGLNEQNPQQYLLPVVLAAGNIDDTTGGSENDIDDDDLDFMTTNWQPNDRLNNPYDSVDVNGDTKADEQDLALFAGNYSPGYDGPQNGSHFIFGMATESGGDLRNTQAYWTGGDGGAPEAFDARSRNQTFAPQVSPDGTQMVAVQQDSRTKKYVLAFSPMDRFRMSAVRFPRDFAWDTLAPSWSPDGERVAFICSWQDDNSGYNYNEGKLCIIDSSGNNFRVLADDAKIYPPAWYDNNVIIYGGTSDNSVCADTLCYFDLYQSSARLLSSNITDADMPTFSNEVPDPYNPLLVYRYTNGSNKTLYRAQPQYNFDGNEFANVETRGNGNHVTMGLSDKVAYYTMFRGDVSWYEFDVVNSQYQTDTEFRRSWAHNGWADNDAFSVDGWFGSPAYATNPDGSNSGLPWDGSSNAGTQFYVERATLQMIP